MGPEQAWLSGNCLLALLDVAATAVLWSAALRLRLIWVNLAAKAAGQVYTWGTRQITMEIPVEPPAGVARPWRFCHMLPGSGSYAGQHK